MIHLITKLSRREKTILYVSLGIMVTVVFDKVVLSPIMANITKTGEEISMQEKKIQRYLHILSQEDAISKDHTQYTKDVSQASSDEEEKSKLLSEIEELARKSSVLLKNIKPGATQSVGPYKKYSVDIETESKVAYLADFMYQMEKSKKLLRIESFQMTPSKKLSATLTTRMTVTEIMVVPQKEKKAAAVATDKQP